MVFDTGNPVKAQKSRHEKNSCIDPAYPLHDCRRDKGTFSNILMNAILVGTDGKPSIRILHPGAEPLLGTIRALQFLKRKACIILPKFFRRKNRL